MHHELVALANKFAIELEYEGHIKGLCHGSCGSVIDAVLIDKSKIEEFNAELDWIKSLINGRRILEPGYSISPEDKNRLLTFLRKMMHHQFPREYISDQKSDSITYNQNIDKTMNSFQSEELRNRGGLHKAAVFSGFYNLEDDTDILNYIFALQETVQNSLNGGVNIPFSLYLNNSRHAYELGYRPDENDPKKPGKWYVFDIGQGRKNAGKIHEFDFNNIAMLRNFLRCAFSTGRKQDNKSHYAIAANLYCAKENAGKAATLSSIFLSNLDNHQLTNITTEKMKQGAFGNSLLYIAAQNGDIKTVSSLIEKNVDPNMQNANGDSALFIAAQNGHTEIVELLIATAADLNLKAKITIFNIGMPIIGTTPIISAARNGHLDIVKLLLDNDADASELHNHTYIFEEKFSELMRKDSLTPDEKKDLIKLYIVLRTSEERSMANSVKRGLTSFFKPACTYTEKMGVAKDLLKALEEGNDFSSNSPALQDSRLKQIYELCFPKNNAVPINNENLQPGMRIAG